MIAHLTRTWLWLPSIVVPATAGGASTSADVYGVLIGVSSKQCGEEMPCFACALDSTDSAEIGVSKIAKLIGECDWGIHDLSRIEIDPVVGVPRFNMSLELGLHLGARLFGQGRHRRKRALILEAKPHRYDAALSDISGQDIVGVRSYQV